MRKLLLPILLFAAFPLLHAQCPNLDFSYRDFTNWKCYISDSWATGQSLILKILKLFTNKIC